MFDTKYSYQPYQVMFTFIPSIQHPCAMKYANMQELIHTHPSRAGQSNAKKKACTNHTFLNSHPNPQNSHHPYVSANK